MRSILEANYSRKLAALKYREVNIPEDNRLKSKQGLLHWHWAFECPPPVKILVKAHLNESKAQGHMRLVLMPIVYNAMGDRANLRAHPLFVAMDREIRRSTYWPLVSHPPPVDGEGVVGDDRGSVRVTPVLIHLLIEGHRKPLWIHKIDSLPPSTLHPSPYSRDPRISRPPLPSTCSSFQTSRRCVEFAVCLPVW